MRMKHLKFKQFLIGAALGLVLLVGLLGGAIADRLFEIKPLDYLVGLRSDSSRYGSSVEQRILNEENVVIDVAENVSPSVVTVVIKTPEQRVLEFDPFGFGLRQRVQGGDPQDIGSGFIVSEDGLIVTNKHVVSEDAEYVVVTQDDTEYEVKEISKDPSNDIAILKIDANGLKPVVLGDSSNLKVGQFAIAIGTALGEFRHTVTTGVISGLGRGIVAGSVYEGFVERLDNVIQTDAAINPGNSGGPLLNSAGEVIGVNVAVASGAENIGFAIPIDLVKEGLREFESTGSFPAKPFLGVQYQMISKRVAVMNELPQGAFILDVVPDSPADLVGIRKDDIITKIDGQELTSEKTLADVISGKHVGDEVTIDVWRNEEKLQLRVKLQASEE